MSDAIMLNDLASRFNAVECDRDIRARVLIVVYSVPDTTEWFAEGVSYAGIGGTPMAFIIALELLAARVGQEPSEFGIRK